MIHGLFDKSATGLGIHPPMTGNLLTGVPIAKAAIIHSGMSFDQVLANRIGQETPQASLVLDNTCILFMSNMFSGTNHDNKRSPLVTAGSLGGTLETGHALNFFDAGDQH